MMKEQYIDLHMHTVFSDGREQPRYILERAQQLGLSVISVTDHNNVDAYAQIAKCREVFDGKIVPGVELSTSYNGELIEVLGYGIDIKKIKGFIDASYNCFRVKQLKERLIILKAYRQRGIVLDESFCEAMQNDPESLFDPNTMSSRTPYLEEMKRHPENALFFGGTEAMERADLRTFLRGYIGNPSSNLYVDVSELYPSLETVIQAIHDAGGYAFLAHCHVYSKEFVSGIDSVVAKYELDGLECYHSYFTAAQSEYTAGYCDKNNIWKSGGSDFHGGRRTDCVLGHSTEGTRLTMSLVQDWMKGINNYV